jgi:hypothetical protein
MASYYEHGNEISGLIKGVKILNQTKEYRILKNSATRGWLVSSYILQADVTLK